MKKKGLSKYLLISLLGTLTLILATIPTCWLLLKNYIEGPEFRQLATSQINHLLRTKGELQSISLKDNTIHCSAYLGQGTENGLFAKIKAEQIKIKINPLAFLKKTWDIKSIDVNKLNIRLHSQIQKGLNTSTPPRTLINQKISPLAKLLPTKTTIQKVTLHQLNLSWPLPSHHATNNAPASTTNTPDYGTLTKTKITLTPQLNHEWKAHGYHGQINHPPHSNLPTLNLDYFQILINLPKIEIIEAKANGPQGGTLNAQGQANFDKTTSTQINYTITDFPSQDILPAKLNSHLEGKVFSTGKIHYQNKALSLTGNIKLKDAYLTGLTVQSKLQQITNLNVFLKLPLHQAHTDFTYTDAKNFTLTNTTIESQTLVNMNGNLSATQGTLSGVFEVGSTDTVLQYIAGARSQVFTISRDNYLWASPPMTISGTTDSLQEDLSPRLKNAFIGEIKDKVIEGIEQGKEILQQTPQKIQETIPKLIDQFIP